MCFTPQIVTIKIAVEYVRRKMVQHNVQDFDCQLSAGKKKVKVACEMVFYIIVDIVIYNYNSAGF